MKPAVRNIMVKLAVLLLWGTAAFAQAPEATATWKVTAGEKTAEGCVLTFTADIIDGWHIYSVSDPYNPVAVTFEQIEGLTVEGELVPVTTPSELDGSEVFYETAVFRQTVRVEGSKTLKGTISWSACNDMFCAAPEEFQFEVEVGDGADASSIAIGPENGADATAIGPEEGKEEEYGD